MLKNSAVFGNVRHCYGGECAAAGAGFPLINAVADMFKGHVNTGPLGDGKPAHPATCIGILPRSPRQPEGLDMMTVLSFLAALAQDMLLAAIPAAGFAMVFNVPKRALKLSAHCWGDGSRQPVLC